MKSDQDLKTTRLTLEPLQPHHAALLFGPLSDAAIYEFIPQNPPCSEEALAERFAKLAVGRSLDGKQIWLNFAVRLVSSAEYIGRVEATIEEAGADIAYLLNPRYWGQGYAQESVRALFEHLAIVHQVRVARAATDTRNDRSAALLKRLGFAFVGRKNDADHFKGGPSHEDAYEIRLSHVS
jgi:RimJ/RimL family protein N-acetyltransferase